MWLTVAHSGSPSSRNKECVCISTAAGASFSRSPSPAPCSSLWPQQEHKRLRITRKSISAIGPEGAATADQQKENTTDREITQKIRRALMDDKTLSTYAHNVKVITQDGHVTLKGPVQTADEKKTVEAKASEVAGDGHVTNQISIAPAKGSNK